MEDRDHASGEDVDIIVAKPNYAEFTSDEEGVEDEDVEDDASDF